MTPALSSHEGRANPHQRSHAMSGTDVPIEAVALIELIAAAVRNELGADIDAYPGHGSPERSDPLNRAFRAIVAAILRREAAGANVSALTVSSTLRHLTEERLL